MDKMFARKYMHKQNAGLNAMRPGFFASGPHLYNTWLSIEMLVKPIAIVLPARAAQGVNCIMVLVRRTQHKHAQRMHASLDVLQVGTREGT